MLSKKSLVRVLLGAIVLLGLLSWGVVSYRDSNYYRPTFETRFSEIKPGNSQDDVIDLLGGPAVRCHPVGDLLRDTARPNSFGYMFGEDNFVVEFGPGGKVSGTVRIPAGSSPVARERECKPYRGGMASQDIAAIFTIIWAICWLGVIVCWIRVLVKLFQTEGALKGLIGLFIPLYPFIWGWIKSRRLKLIAWMSVWTILFVVGSIAVGFRK